MTQEEWSRWCVAEVVKDVGKGLLFYALLLVLYWSFVG